MPHIAYWLGTPIGNFEAYLAQTLAALNAQWQSITDVVKSGKTTITGTLQVVNFGTQSASGFKVTYYLSADDQLDASDTVIGSGAVAAGAGQKKVIKFNYSPNGPVSGEYLIAVVSHTNPQAEADTSNNQAVGQIP